MRKSDSRAGAGRRRFAPLALAIALMGGVGVLAAPAANAAEPSYLRLAHLSPDTPKVDVYLAPLGQSSASKVVLEQVPYGAMSPYRTLDAGSYTIAMRPAGAKASTPPVITKNIRLSAKNAYTLAGVGMTKELKLELFADDLTPPAADATRIRIVQAASTAPKISVTRAGGSAIADGVAFGTTTDYAEVPAGQTSLEVTPAGGTAKASTADVDLKAGAVVSMVVVNGANDTLDITTIVDAEGMSKMPVGAVETGAGGMADGAGSTPSWTSPALLGVALAAALAGLLTVTYRRLQPKRF